MILEMQLCKTIIISPSGNYYGSEQVLVDFLLNSSNYYTVYIPFNSRLAAEIQSLKLKHIIKHYSLRFLKLFYLKIALLFLFRRVNKIYINEGGHIRYIKLLAKLYPSAKFFVHLRILEDTELKRTGKIITPNITFITVSNFMLEHLKHIGNKVMIYDPYNFSNYLCKNNTDVKKELRIGIVGRIVANKGIKDILGFFKFLIINDSAKNYSFHFFGEVFYDKETIELITEIKNLKNIKIKFHGFISNKRLIYENINCLLHFNKYEPLGRIFFEALEYHKPLIGFNSGGIAELANINCLQDLLIEYESENKWYKEMLSKLEKVRSDYTIYQQRLREQLPLSSDLFNVQKYAMKLDLMFR